MAVLRWDMGLRANKYINGSKGKRLYGGVKGKRVGTWAFGQTNICKWPANKSFCFDGGVRRKGEHFGRRKRCNMGLRATNC